VENNLFANCLENEFFFNDSSQQRAMVTATWAAVVEAVTGNRAARYRP
jgi:hypothetical protein